MFQKQLRISVFVLVTVAALADDKLITNKQLIAAMPPGVDSVMVVRIVPFAAKDSVLQPPPEIRAKMPPEELALYEIPFLPPPEQSVLSGAKKLGLDRAVLRAVRNSRPVAWACGGSGFTAGGIGIGNFVQRSIWVVEDELPALSEIIAATNGLAAMVEELEIENRPAYQARIEFASSPPTKKTIWVARPTSHTVAFAESKDELAEMVRSVRSRAADIPKKWQSASAGLDLDAAFVILRKYNPADERDQTSPLNPKKPVKMRVRIEAVGITMPSAAEPTLILNCVSPEPNLAIEYYRAPQYRFYMLPELRWEWKTQERNNGFTATVRFKTETGANHHIELVLFSLFGMNLQI